MVWHKDTKPTHSDILAFDIQRGRDHGLQPYHKYFEICSLKRPVNSWKDFEGFIPNDVGLKNNFFTSFYIFFFV